MKPPKLVRASGGVVIRDGARRAGGASSCYRRRYDDWTFPKGKREPGETDEQCAVREVEEETGLRCALGRELLPVTYLDPKRRPKLVRYWEMRVLGERPFTPNDEIEDVQWLPDPRSLSRGAFVRTRRRRRRERSAVVHPAFTRGHLRGNPASVACAPCTRNGRCGLWVWSPRSALLGAACSSDSKTASTTGGSSSSSSTTSTFDYSSLTGTLNGSGSSFQDAFNQKAKAEFAKVASGVTLNYTKSGSGAGKTDLANQVVQFAGTDSLIKDADKPTFKGGDVLYFPTVGAPITVSYNLSGVDKLQLSGDTLGGIFGGRSPPGTTRRSRPTTQATTLPSTPIAVVHRSDASGTTSNFTKFLTKAGAHQLDARHR